MHKSNRRGHLKPTCDQKEAAARDIKDRTQEEMEGERNEKEHSPPDPPGIFMSSVTCHHSFLPSCTHSHSHLQMRKLTQEIKGQRNQVAVTWSQGQITDSVKIKAFDLFSNIVKCILNDYTPT